MSTLMQRTVRAARAITIAAATLSLTILAAGSARAQQAPPKPVDPGDVALAERLFDTAKLTLSGRMIMPQHWRMAAALLEGASRLNPQEPRYPRLWADAALSARDVDGAIKATKAWYMLEPDDKQALIQLTNLHTTTYQSVDKKLAYLRDWIDDNRLPEEVRSHVAFLAYQSYAERAQKAEAKSMLDTALKLNPVSVEALRARWEVVARDGTPYERASTLMALLKANPGQLDAVTELARLLSDVGLAKESLPFFGGSVSLAQRQGIGVPPEFGVAYAEALALANQTQPAQQLVTSVVAARPSDYDALALKLLVERLNDQKDAAAKTQKQLLNVLLNRLQTLRQQTGVASATTRPVDSADKIEWGSLEDDVKRVKAMKDNDDAAASARQQLGAVLTEMAWVEIYFANDPAEAKPIIDALRGLLPEDSPVLARLEGWSFLAKGQNAEAKVKLTAARDRDPLAELGAIRLLDAAAGKKEGDQFLANHPNGLLAVLALDALRDRKVSLTPPEKTAGPIAEALSKFPMEWLGILDQPQNFYILRGEPLHVPHAYGEPIFVRITVQNISNYPITIGNDGVLHPDLWIDAQVRGGAAMAAPQMLSGVAFDRLTHDVVLKPHAQLYQVIRVDQGQLAQMLTSSPFPSLQIVMAVRTNPSTTSQQGVGPAGQFVQLSRFAERSAFPFNGESVKALAKAITSGGAAEKIRTIELVGNVAVICVQQKDNPAFQQAAQQLVELLKTAAHDTSTPVQTWANVTIARLSAPAERPVAIQRLANDPYWVARLLGLSSMGAMPGDDQKKIAANAAANDADPCAKAYAAALVDLLEHLPAAPATGPAIGPATGPTTAPALPTTFGPGPLTTGGGAATSKPAIVIPSVPLTLPPEPGK